LSSDIVVIGAVDNGYGLEAFAQRKLQASGKNIAISIRFGTEYEWIPGHLRIRGGSYWEPGRFQGVGGRPHLTMGAEYRFWQFRFWGSPYRLRLSAIGDFADNYVNAGLSVGFWH